jgi:hypothetical protein
MRKRKPSRAVLRTVGQRVMDVNHQGEGPSIAKGKVLRGRVNRIERLRGGDDVGGTIWRMPWYRSPKTRTWQSTLLSFLAMSSTTGRVTSDSNI